MTVATPREFEIGIFSLGELTDEPRTGRAIEPVVRVREFIDLARIADEVGLDVVGVGEHHRRDFAITSPAIVLAAVAQATLRIRLTSTVTVLSTHDPVRVFENFVGVDLISNGRAEITAGRGAYTESLPLQGFDLGDYDALFDEQLDLLERLARESNHLVRRARRSSWVVPKSSSRRSSGSTRSSVTTASSPKSGSQADPSPRRPNRSSCSRPRCSRSCGANSPLGLRSLRRARDAKRFSARVRDPDRARVRCAPAWPLARGSATTRVPRDHPTRP